MQMPCHKDTVASTEKPDLANQRFDYVKVFVNTGNVFVEIILSAGTRSRFQQLSYIKSHGNRIQPK